MILSGELETPELYADPDFLGAAFFGTQGATYEPMRGSMSCLCWICAGGGDAAEAAKNLQRCISLCKLKVQLPSHQWWSVTMIGKE
eukprot:s4011_g3.t1